MILLRERELLDALELGAALVERDCTDAGARAGAVAEWVGLLACGERAAGAERPTDLRRLAVHETQGTRGGEGVSSRPVRGWRQIRPLVGGLEPGRGTQGRLPRRRQRDLHDAPGG